MRNRYLKSILILLFLLSMFAVGIHGRVLLEKEWRFVSLTPSNLTGEKAINILPYIGGRNNDILEIPTGSPSLNSINSENWNKDQFTILMWLNLNFFPGDGVTHQLLSNNVGGGNGIAAFIFTDGTLYFDVTDKDALLHRFSSSITGWSAGDWHQVALRLDFKNDQAELYVDGASVDSTPTNPFSDDSIDAIETDTDIGHVAGALQLNGSTTLLIEGRSWSDAEITANYAAGAGTPFVVGPDTLALGNYSDGETSITYHHQGKAVSAISNSGTESSLTVPGGGDTSFADNDAVTVSDATGRNESGFVDDSPTSNLVKVDDGAGALVSGMVKVGKSLSFNGSESVDCGNDASLRITGNLSVSAWINFSASQENIGIVSRWDSNQSYLLMTPSGGANKLAFFIRVGGANKSAISTNTYNDGKWHHAVGVFDGSNVLLYIDGNAEIITGDATGGPIDNPADNVMIGLYSGVFVFTGNISEVIIASAAATAADALQIATNPGQSLTELVAGTSFALGDIELKHDYSAGVLTDETANSNDGTHSGTPSYVTSAHISRNRILDIEHGGIGGYTIVGTPTLVDKESDTDSDSLSLHIVSAADNDGVAQTIQASNGEKFYLAQRHKVTAGTFEVNVTNGGGSIETAINDAGWTLLEKIISATDTLTFQWLGEGAGDDFNISKASILQCVAGNALDAGTYYTRVFNVDTSNVGAEWSGLGSDATEVQAGDLYVRDDTAATTATKGDGLIPLGHPFFPAEWQ